MQAKDLPLALAIYAAAAFFEIAGSFAIWSVTRLNRSTLWLIPGIAALVIFAWLLTRTDLTSAGRAYAAYGGIYIIASLVWLWRVEGQLPTLWDITGASLCMIGASIILIGARAAA